MSIKFFGQYLLEKKAITTEQLLDALTFQESRNLKFGDYAVSKGYLKPEELDRLNEEQKRTDMFIGELAVKDKLLTSTQVDEILMMQKNDHIQLGQVLVLKKFIDEKRLGVELKAFKEEQAVYAVDKVKVPDGVKHPDFMSEVLDLSVKLTRRVTHLEVKMGEGRILKSEPARSFAAISITFSGAVNFDYVVIADEAVSRMLAGSVIGDDVSNDPEDIIIDGLKEYANIVCGNIIASFAKRGKSVEISIPHVLAHAGASGYGLTKQKGTIPVGFPIATTGGNIEVVYVEY